MVIQYGSICHRTAQHFLRYPLKMPAFQPEGNIRARSGRSIVLASVLVSRAKENDMNIEGA
jgi:hypothetical protein